MLSKGGNMAHQFLFNSYILDNLPAPSSGFDVVQDTAEPRLKLYITNRGVKSFFVRKRVAGKDKRIIIGKYPEISIDDAREAVEDVLKIANEKPKMRRKKTGFGKITDLYLIKKVRRNDESKDKLVRSMALHLALLFDKNVQDITSDDISNVLSAISGAAVSNRMHELLNSIFNFAIDSGYIITNPVVVIDKVNEQRRVRPLNRNGFSRLFNAINVEQDPNLRAAFLMLIYGFAPKSKIFSMQWRDLDFNRYTWNDRPLSDAAVVLLTDLPQNGKWVFPGRGGRHLTDPRTSWQHIATRARIPNLTMDDVYKFMTRQLVWASDKESMRMNMNMLIDSIIV